MPPTYDVILAGLGAMGSAAAFHLARRGRRVLGLDRFAPPHALGSSHGQTRIIREAYFEHPAYVPLVQRAYELWAELEQFSGRRLLRQTGGLLLGAPDGVVISGARRSALEHRLRHQLLTRQEVQRRYPAFEPDEEMIGLWEPRAGFLYAEACVEAHLSGARAHGAELKFDEPVKCWAPEGAGVRVTTPRGTYPAGQLVITAGPWVMTLLADLRLPLTVERQVLFWFDPGQGRALFQPDACPIHIWETAPGRYFYGFPDVGTGVKVARHHEGEIVDPDTVRREVSPDEVESMRALVRRYLPRADGAWREAVTCLYTNTPDGHFLIDRHPAHPTVLIASPCSGHGFKFSSAVGEALAELVIDGRSRLDLGLFGYRW